MMAVLLSFLRFPDNSNDQRNNEQYELIKLFLTEEHLFYLKFLDANNKFLLIQKIKSFLTVESENNVTPQALNFPEIALFKALGIYYSDAKWCLPSDELILEAYQVPVATTKLIEKTNELVQWLENLKKLRQAIHKNQFWVVLNYATLQDTQHKVPKGVAEIDQCLKIIIESSCWDWTYDDQEQMYCMPEKIKAAFDKI